MQQLMGRITHAAIGQQCTVNTENLLGMQGLQAQAQPSN